MKNANPDDPRGMLRRPLRSIPAYVVANAVSNGCVGCGDHTIWAGTMLLTPDGSVPPQASAVERQALAVRGFVCAACMALWILDEAQTMPAPTMRRCEGCKRRTGSVQERPDRFDLVLCDACSGGAL